MSIQGLVDLEVGPLRLCWVKREWFNALAMKLWGGESGWWAIIKLSSHCSNIGMQLSVTIWVTLIMTWCVNIWCEQGLGVNKQPGVNNGPRNTFGLPSRCPLRVSVHVVQFWHCSWTSILLIWRLKTSRFSAAVPEAKLLINWLKMWWPLMAYYSAPFRSPTKHKSRIYKPILVALCLLRYWQVYPIILSKKMLI